MTEPTGVSSTHCTSRQRLELAGEEVDCTELKAALLRRRSMAEQQQADESAIWLRAETPHLDVPTSELVAFMRPGWSTGAPENPDEAADIDQVIKFLLCDALTREVVTQQFLPHHPEYLP